MSSDLPELEEIWTYDLTCLAPIKTACEKDRVGYPHRTVDGIAMYNNTHFRTLKEAWGRLVESADACAELDARNYRYAKAELEKTTAELVESSARAIEIRAAHRAFLQMSPKQPANPG